MSEKGESLYTQLIVQVFKTLYRDGDQRVDFETSDIRRAADELNTRMPQNISALVYAFSHRDILPPELVSKTPLDRMWVLRRAGRGKYRLQVMLAQAIYPDPNLVETEVRDATPQLVAENLTEDEQALLSRVRYNDLISKFTGVTAYSLQSHYRTSLPDWGQVEVDELYVGMQDLALCQQKFPELICRPIGIHRVVIDDRMNGLIVMWELDQQENWIRIIAQKHYRLVTPD
jgi:hypothetical protein